jgi:hypothetical protein
LRVQVCERELWLLCLPWAIKSYRVLYPPSIFFLSQNLKFSLQSVNFWDSVLHPLFRGCGLSMYHLKSLRSMQLLFRCECDTREQILSGGVYNTGECWVDIFTFHFSLTLCGSHNLVVRIQKKINRGKNLLPWYIHCFGPTILPFSCYKQAKSWVNSIIYVQF